MASLLMQVLLGLGMASAVTAVEQPTAASLLPQLEAAFGPDGATVIESRVEGLEQTLRPSFASMPKNEYGKLGRPAVRYILHRLFMQRGWSVRGLEPVGQAWTVGSPMEMLGEQLPRQVQELFEERLHEHGFDLHDVAVLAAAFQQLISTENAERLQAAYQALEVERQGALDEDTANEILDVYLTGYIRGMNLSSMGASHVRLEQTRLSRQYGNWAQVQRLARNVKQQVVRGGSASFSNLQHVVEEVGEHFGPFEDGECRERKRELMAVERDGSGRVRLADFYRLNVHEGKWHFGESTGYLRQLGALDESHPDDLQVIIPNYVNSKSNCLDPSQYYSVCCLNECNELLASLEQRLGSATATAAEIATLVAATASATVPGNRTLPVALLRRLESVAQEHSGRIPLHGRLFTQWMHHAYPRECPFPHLSGTTNPQRVQEWAVGPGNSVVAAMDEMLAHIDTPERERLLDADDDGECAPWMHHEELLEPTWPPAAEVGSTAKAERRGTVLTWRGLSAIAMPLAFASGAVRWMKSADPIHCTPKCCDGETVVYNV